jgi:biopolymer transport protein ExbD
MKRRWRKQHLSQPAEVNITAFMNLMVILVPFLLITAVFSRITILDLNLPVPGKPNQPAQQDEKEKLELEVIVRQDVVEIGDRKRGRLKLISVNDDGSYLTEISAMLQQIKARFPDKTDITLLLETDIPYQRLVEMMDTLRVVKVQQGEESVNAELFPAISIGDAPLGKLRTAEGKNK